MKKNLIFLTLIITIISIFGILNFQTKRPIATINNHTFNLEIVKTQKDQEIGLSKYNSISNNFGMLFDFEKEGHYSFWMKNMKFPIDIIFIKNNKIVKIFDNVSYPKSNNEKLPVYTPDSVSDSVLEINGGLSEKYNFKNGDLIEIKL